MHPARILLRYVAANMMTLIDVLTVFGVVLINTKCVAHSIHPLNSKTKPEGWADVKGEDNECFAKKVAND